MFRKAACGRLLSVLFRVIGLVVRFALTAYIAKVFTIQEFGLFSILVAAVYMAPVVFGFGLHYCVNRDFVTMPGESVARVLVDKALVSMTFTPGIFAASIAICSAYKLAPVNWGSCSLISLIALAELILADLNFALLSVGKTAIANFIQFLRTAAWIPLFVLAVEIRFCPADIDGLLKFWAVGQFVALITFVIITRSWAWRSACRGARNFRYLLTNFRSKCLPVYVADLGSVGTQYADRFIIGAFLGVEKVGIYVYYWTLANGVAQLLTTGVVQPALPRFVAAFNGFRMKGLLSKVAHEMKIVLVIFIPLIPVAYWSGTWLTSHLGKSEFVAFSWVLLVLLLGFCLRTISDLFSYGLYAARADLQLVTINISSFAVILAVSGCLTFWFGLTGATVGFMAASAAVLGIKYATLFKTGIHLTR